MQSVYYIDNTFVKENSTQYILVHPLFNGWTFVLHSRLQQQVTGIFLPAFQPRHQRCRHRQGEKNHRGRRDAEFKIQESLYPSLQQGKNNIARPCIQQGASHGYVPGMSPAGKERHLALPENQDHGKLHRGSTSPEFCKLSYRPLSIFVHCEQRLSVHRKFVVQYPVQHQSPFYRHSRSIFRPFTHPE